MIRRTQESEQTKTQEKRGGRVGDGRQLMEDRPVFSAAMMDLTLRSEVMFVLRYVVNVSLRWNLKAEI